MISQLVKKQTGVGDDPDRLRRTAVGQLRDDGRIDVHANRADRGRQHVADADAVQHARQNQHQTDILAFVLSKGNFPAGTTELPGATDVLNTIKFVAQKPAQ